MTLRGCGFAALLVLASACGGDGTNAARDAAGGDSRADGAVLPDGAADGAPAPDGGSADGGAADGGGASCGAIHTFADGLTPSREVHVAADGDDNAGDGSVGSPFATIGRAAQEATPGTAIRVHAGTYSGRAYLENLAGEPGAPIWIGGAPSEARPVLTQAEEALHLSRVRYLVVHDLEVAGTTANGINCDDGSDYANAEATRYLVFRGLYVHDVGSGGNQDGLKLSGVNDYFVLDSEFTRCGGTGGGSGIDHVGCHRGLIARNYFHDLGANAVQCKGGSEDIEIRWNRFFGGGERAVNMGGSTGFEFFRPPLSTGAANAEARDIRVVANVIANGWSALAFVGCVDCLAAHNTIVNPENWILRILQETTSSGGYTFLPASNGRFVNNLVYFDRSSLSTYVNIGPDTAPETFTFAHNLWYAHDDPAASTPDLPVAETGAVIGQDPGFAGLPEDGHISPTSPAVGAGTPLAEVAGDFTGACYATPPSIGAYEAR